MTAEGGYILQGGCLAFLFGILRIASFTVILLTRRRIIKRESGIMKLCNFLLCGGSEGVESVGVDVGFDKDLNILHIVVGVGK